MIIVIQHSEVFNLIFFAVVDYKFPRKRWGFLPPLPDFLKVAIVVKIICFIEIDIVSKRMPGIVVR
jgi:hypothetical protein